MAIVRIRVLFFGVVRDITGVREDTLEVPAESRLAAVFEHYASRLSTASRDVRQPGSGSKSTVF